MRLHARVLLRCVVGQDDKVLMYLGYENFKLSSGNIETHDILLE